MLDIPEFPFSPAELDDKSKQLVYSIEGIVDSVHAINVGDDTIRVIGYKKNFHVEVDYSEVANCIEVHIDRNTGHPVGVPLCTVSALDLILGGPILASYQVGKYIDSNETQSGYQLGLPLQ